MVYIKPDAIHIKNTDDTTTEGGDVASNSNVVKALGYGC